MSEPPLSPSREWVTFDDPAEDGRHWQFDVTFMTSRWRCIYGHGCQGVRTEPSPEMFEGCCSYGAHFDNTADRDRVVKAARELNRAEWQFAARGERDGVVARSGKGWRTRLVDDACIFLNRPDFEAGPGCALHLLAERRGVHFSETKPEICWQLPIRRADHMLEDGSVTSVVTEFTRASWGGGGEDFAWWCTEDPRAFDAAEPVFVSLEAELRATCGDAVYEALAAYLAERIESAHPPVGHPTSVPVRLGRKRP